jgi:rubrerythrin
MDEGERKRVAEGLAKAIRAEIEGHHFYRMAATTTDDEKGKAVFGRLAEEEMEHAEFLRAHHAAIRETGAPSPDAKLSSPLDLSGGSPIFSEELKARARTAHFEMTALSVGVQLELGAIQFYRAEAEASTEPVVKEFYEELARWESGHYEALLRQMEEMKGDYWSASGFAPF